MSAVKYGYTAKFTPVADLIRERDLKLWKEEGDHLQQLFERSSPHEAYEETETGVMITFCCMFGLKGSSSDSSIDVFLTLSRNVIYIPLFTF